MFGYTIVCWMCEYLNKLVKKCVFIPAGKCVNICVSNYTLGKCITVIFFGSSKFLVCLLSGMRKHSDPFKLNVFKWFSPTSIYISYPIMSKQTQICHNIAKKQQHWQVFRLYAMTFEVQLQRWFLWIIFDIILYICDTLNYLNMIYGKTHTCLYKV